MRQGHDPPFPHDSGPYIHCNFLRNGDSPWTPADVLLVQTLPNGNHSWSTVVERLVVVVMMMMRRRRRKRQDGILVSTVVKFVLEVDSYSCCLSSCASFSCCCCCCYSYMLWIPMTRVVWWNQDAWANAMRIMTKQ